MSTPRLTILLPVYDEAPALPALFAEIERAAAATGLPWEVLFVDDGSRDNSFAVLSELHAKAKGQVRVLRLDGHHGKTAALALGFAEARGEIIVTMDSDGQDDPAEMPRLLATLDEGYDLVSGWKVNRQDPASKVLGSRVFNWAVRRLTGTRLHDVNCGFKAYRAAVARSLPLYGDMHRFLPVLAAARGARVGELAVAHRPRTQGRSKYGWGRALRGLVDLVAVAWGTRREFPPSALLVMAILGLLLAGEGVVQAARVATHPSAHAGWLAGRWLFAALLFGAGVAACLAGTLGLQHHRRATGSTLPPVAERLE